jgi:uncharacterized protein YjbI with pentapeptide repeats
MAIFPKHWVIPEYLRFPSYWTTRRKLFFALLGGVVLDFMCWLVLDKSLLYGNAIRLYHAHVYQSMPIHKKDAVRDVVLASAALITLAFSFWRNSIFSNQIKTLQKQTENQTEQLTLQTQQVENQTRELQIKDQTRNDEQFKQAVEMLGKADAGFAAQQGAVFILVALAQRSPEHTQRCVDMLCSLNEWVAERLEVESDYFKREDKADKKFIPWISRVFWENNTAMTAYWNRYLRHSAETESASINGDCTKQVLAAMNREKLSQLVVKEMRKILQSLSDSNTDKKEDEQQTLTLAQRYLPQLDGSGLLLGKMVNWQEARLPGAVLYEAQLQGAVLRRAQLQGAVLREAQLQGADLIGVQLQGADLREAQLQGAYLIGVQLQGADLREAQLQGAYLSQAQLQGADLFQAQLQGADLFQAQLQGADLYEAKLQGAVLRRAQLQGAVLYHTSLMGIDDTNTDWAGTYVANPNFTTRADWVTLLANPNLSEWAKEQLIKRQVRSDAWAAESKTLSLPYNTDDWKAAIVALATNNPDWRLPILKRVKEIQESDFYPDALRTAAGQAIAAIEALP